MFSALKQLAARVRAFSRASDLDRDLHHELESHLGMLVEENVRRGMTPEQARRSARLQLGAATQLREAHRETRSLPFLEAAMQDLRYTFRTLRRDGAFAVFAVLIIGLGVGATATIFSVVNALLLRPLPFEDPGRLVWIENHAAEGLSGQTVPVGHFVDLRDRNQSFSGIAAYYAFYGVGDSKLTGDGEPQRLNAVPVSWNFFDPWA
jgi:hypothetical protein